MDQFLEHQQSGRRLDQNQSFTVTADKARERVLASAPQMSRDPVLRLLDAAAAEYGVAPESAWTVRGAVLQFRLPELEAAQVQMLLEELYRPFGVKPGATKLARAIYRAAATNTVEVRFSSASIESCLIRLSPGNAALPEVPPTIVGPGISVVFDGGVREAKSHRHRLVGQVHERQKLAEHLVPGESQVQRSEGYFADRCRPFTALRCYTTAQNAQPLLMNLWKEGHDRIDSHTCIVARRPASFLKLWRPDYGRPTFVQARLDAALNFGRQYYGTSFWIDTEIEGHPSVQFFSGGIVSDPVVVNGPPGLHGLVTWPGLLFDLWGTALVRDCTYETAIEWTQTQVEAAARLLAQNLSMIRTLMSDSNLLHPKYHKDIFGTMERLWGKTAETQKSQLR